MNRLAPNLSRRGKMFECLRPQVIPHIIFLSFFFCFCFEKTYYCSVYPFWTRKYPETLNSRSKFKRDISGGIMVKLSRLRYSMISPKRHVRSSWYWCLSSILRHRKVLKLMIALLHLIVILELMTYLLLPFPPESCSHCNGWFRLFKKWIAPATGEPIRFRITYLMDRINNCACIVPCLYNRFLSKYPEYPKVNEFIEIGLDDVARDLSKDTLLLAITVLHNQS